MNVCVYSISMAEELDDHLMWMEAANFVGYEVGCEVGYVTD